MFPTVVAGMGAGFMPGVRKSGILGLDVFLLQVWGLGLAMESPYFLNVIPLPRSESASLCPSSLLSSSSVSRDCHVFFAELQKM